MTTERAAWVLLNHVPQLGPARIKRLLDYAGSAMDIVRLPLSGLQSAGVSDPIATLWYRTLRDPDVQRQVDDELEKEQKQQLRILIDADPDYPEALRETSGHPKVLYSQGRPLPSEGLSLAIVGTRKVTPYGRHMTEEITQTLVESHVNVISGLALGVDAQAHRTTLKEGGHTVAVLGHGLGHRYPRENSDLYDQMLSDGTLLSEFPYNTAPDSSYFPRRNRIISGLSKGVIVIEAGERSGALITARYAAEQNRDVFALPGPVSSWLSRGCHRLIKEGAQLIENGRDVLASYGLNKDSDTPAASESGERAEERSAAAPRLPTTEARVWKQCAEGPITVDDLAVACGLPIDQLANALLSLELKGLIRNLPGQRYATND